MKGNSSRMKSMKFAIRPMYIVICSACLFFTACQSSSQSSQSMPSSPSQSSSSSRSMPSSPSQNSASSPPDLSPTLPNSSAQTASQENQEQPEVSGPQTIPGAKAPPGQESRQVGDPLPSGGGAAAMPAIESSRGGQPGEERIGSMGGRDTSTGDINGENGRTISNLPSNQSQSGDYSLDTLPNGVLGGANQAQGRGATTAQERARVLDERLRKGYETFDGFILSEREKAQNESNAAGSSQPGADGGGGNAQYQPQTMQEAVGDPSGVLGAPQTASTRSREAAESFPAPDDIPSGRDDDVVARQLREAAMSEPDPELREALWDEYRNYTGLSGGTDQ